MNEFQFTNCIEIKELLGVKADDELSLLELLEEVSIDSIYFHMHSYFLRHVYVSGIYPNDFANWVTIQVRDRVLGEKLATVTPNRNLSLDDLRYELIDIIDRHLHNMKIIPSITYGEPFYFMKSKIIEVPTDIKVKNLKEFINALKIVDASSIYNHIFESQMRLKRRSNDFSIWLEDILKLNDLAHKIDQLDSYMFTLESLREKLIFLCSGELNK
jgi:hypothetical protein